MSVNLALTSPSPTMTLVRCRWVQQQQHLSHSTCTSDVHSALVMYTVHALVMYTVHALVMSSSSRLSVIATTLCTCFMTYNSMTVSSGLPRWLSWLRRSAHQLARSVGGAGVQFPRSTGRFRVRITGAHALRLISWTGKEGSMVSSIICDRWLILS